MKRIEFSQKAAEMGRRGGKSRSPAKIRAALRNLYKSWVMMRSGRFCKVCCKKQLSKRNRSGICRACQRRPGMTAKVKAWIEG